MDRNFKQRPLQSMNDALEGTGNLLSGITDNHAKSLDVVTQCQGFILWLKETIKGKNLSWSLCDY